MQRLLHFQVRESPRAKYEMPWRAETEAYRRVERHEPLSSRIKAGELFGGFHAPGKDRNG
jgi:hypothetical protein